MNLQNYPNYTHIEAGSKFGRLTVLGQSRRRLKNRATFWRVRCACGVVKIVNRTALTDGQTSCGCLGRKHMMSNSPEWDSWRGMKKRCYLKKQEAYKNYGGRGITVCERWKNSFANFLEDMGRRPKQTSLGRIDTNGNYEPSNCRWETVRQQSRNRRNSKIWHIFGRTFTSSKEAAKKLGIASSSVVWFANNKRRGCYSEFVYEQS